MATPKNIIIKYRDDSMPLIKEAIAVAAVTPGHLLEMTTAGKVQKHATAGGNARPMFAVEQAQVDSLSALDIDTACAADDQIPYVVALPGDEIYAFVEVAGSAIVIGDLLESAGDGTLQKHTAPSQAVDEGGAATYTIAPKTKAIVGYALEAVDNSAGATAARIKIEVA